MERRFEARLEELVEDAVLDPRIPEGMLDRLERFVKPFAAIVESPDGAFEPLVVHYAETFIIPAAVGRYTVRPHGPAAAGGECATMKAYVRTGL